MTDLFQYWNIFSVNILRLFQILLYQEAEEYILRYVKRVKYIHPPPTRLFKGFFILVFGANYDRDSRLDSSQEK